MSLQTFESNLQTLLENSPNDFVRYYHGPIAQVIQFLAQEGKTLEQIQPGLDHYLHTLIQCPDMSPEATIINHHAQYPFGQLEPEEWEQAYAGRTSYLNLPPALFSFDNGIVFMFSKIEYVKLLVHFAVANSGTMKLLLSWLLNPIPGQTTLTERLNDVDEYLLANHQSITQTQNLLCDIYDTNRQYVGFSLNKSILLHIMVNQSSAHRTALYDTIDKIPTLTASDQIQNVFTGSTFPKIAQHHTEEQIVGRLMIDSITYPTSGMAHHLLNPAISHAYQSCFAVLSQQPAFPSRTYGSLLFNCALVDDVDLLKLMWEQIWLPFYTTTPDPTASPDPTIPQSPSPPNFIQNSDIARNLRLNLAPIKILQYLTTMDPMGWSKVWDGHSDFDAILTQILFHPKSSYIGVSTAPILRQQEILRLLFQTIPKLSQAFWKASWTEMGLNADGDDNSNNNNNTNNNSRNNYNDMSMAANLSPSFLWKPPPVPTPSLPIAINSASCPFVSELISLAPVPIPVPKVWELFSFSKWFGVFLEDWDQQAPAIAGAAFNFILSQPPELTRIRPNDCISLPLPFQLPFYQLQQKLYWDRQESTNSPQPLDGEPSLPLLFVILNLEPHLALALWKQLALHRTWYPVSLNQMFSLMGKKDLATIIQQQQKQQQPSSPFSTPSPITSSKLSRVERLSIRFSHALTPLQLATLSGAFLPTTAANTNRVVIEGQNNAACLVDDMINYYIESLLTGSVDIDHRRIFVKLQSGEND